MKSTPKKKNKKIRYGKFGLPEDAFNPRETKFRVTMFVDLDVLDKIREMAKYRGLPYQTYINQMLRDAVFGSEFEDKVRKIVRDELTKK
jgi:predicted DNA binding CopG/RHH family protein